MNKVSHTVPIADGKLRGANCYNKMISTIYTLGEVQVVMGTHNIGGASNPFWGGQGSGNS